MSFTDRLVAHRGYTHSFPENTLLAIEQAIMVGAKYIEVDVQLTADEVPVLFHDRDLKRLCQGMGSIHDYAYSQLDQFHPMNPEKFGDQFEDITIPRLDELVYLLQEHPHITAFIELKRISLNKFGDQSMVERVIEELAPVKMQCVIISYSVTALECVRLNGWQQVGAVIDMWDERETESIVALKPEYLFVDHESLPESGQLDFGESQLAVFECIDPERARQLMHRGIELVETFNIEMMIKALADQA